MFYELFDIIKNMKKKTVCVIGLGYIGLPTAALLANKGYYVAGVDINEEVVSTINKGEIHIVEADLGTFVKSAISSGQLKAFNEIQPSDVYIICVPTPFHKNGNIPQPNIDHILLATKSIAPFIKPGDLIILESTSPVGTTVKVKKTLIECGANLEEIHIAYCPERVLPGKIMTELIENDRIVGGVTPISTKKVVDFYRLFVNGNILETDAKTAEMCKLAENSFRDLNIAFANELSMICDKQQINVWDLIRLANKHPRVNILQPGTGVGGHCIAVDPWFIVSQDVENTKLIRSAREVNDRKAKWVIDKIKNIAAKHLSKTGIKPKITCLGLAFKPDIDDLRESKALEVVETLLLEGHEISAVEPNIRAYKNLKLKNLLDAIDQADIICVMVKHREFLNSKIKEKLIKCGAFDFCGALL
jgi:UDP-N-acetyl-D-mannosaminuronic acid dehydrogenase|tara:strand:+ start:584 stop:1837 length:1254 start_codon:yes stop_codon:yes gene_type:complete